MKYDPEIWGSLSEEGESQAQGSCSVLLFWAAVGQNYQNDTGTSVKRPAHSNMGAEVKLIYFLIH